MMRIALLTDGIAPYVMGGMQKHSFYLAKFFAINGVFVDLYHTGKVTDDLKSLSCFSEEEKKYISATHIPFPSLGRLPGHYIRESYAYSVAIYKAYLQKKEPVDFIYAQGFCGWEMLLQKKAGKLLPPVGVHFHGLEMFQKPAGFRSRLEQFMLRKPTLLNLQNADYAFSLGGKLTDILKEQGLPGKKILEIPLGIDESWINPAIEEHTKKKITFVFIGRNERRKGIPELNAALSGELKNENFEFHFIGPLPENVQLNLPQIQYHGSISDSLKIKTILETCDVLVCPSHSEGMPNVIVEAMASGLAVIATDVGAVSVLVSDKTGWLLPSPDSKGIAAAMKAAMKMSPQLMQAKKVNARNLVTKEFLWKEIIKKTIAAIQLTFNK